MTSKGSDDVAGRENPLSAVKLGDAAQCPVGTVERNAFVMLRGGGVGLELRLHGAKARSRFGGVTALCRSRASPQLDSLG